MLSILHGLSGILEVSGYSNMFNIRGGGGGGGSGLNWYTRSYGFSRFLVHLKLLDTQTSFVGSYRFVSTSKFQVRRIP